MSLDILLLSRSVGNRKKTGVTFETLAVPSRATKSKRARKWHGAGKEAGVADAYQAVRKQVQQEATEEFINAVRAFAPEDSRANDLDFTRETALMRVQCA